MRSPPSASTLSASDAEPVFAKIGVARAHVAASSLVNLIFQRGEREQESRQAAQASRRCGSCISGDASPHAAAVVAALIESRTHSLVIVKWEARALHPFTCCCCRRSFLTRDQIRLAREKNSGIPNAFSDATEEELDSKGCLFCRRLRIIGTNRRRNYF
jgi:hypothetical protein